MKYKMIRVHESTYRLLKRFKGKYVPWNVFLRELVRKAVL